MRKLLLTAMLLALALVLLACGGAAQPAEPEVITVVETSVVEVTTVVEGEEVIVTQVVENEVVVTATPTDEEIARQEEQAAEADVVTMHYNHHGEPPSLDPSLATDSTSIDVLSNIFLTLGRFDEEANVVPWAATEWTVSEDGRTYTFTLRDDLMWVYYDPNTGEVTEQRPITSADFLYGAMRTLDPATASDYAYVLYQIEGAEAYNTADTAALAEEEVTALRDAVGIRAPDASTIEITYNEPIGFGAAFPAMWIMAAQPQEVIEEFGDQWTEAGIIWTSGPYTIESWRHNAELDLVKNPHYFDADNVQIERIDGVMIVEDSTAMSLYESGGLDITSPPLADMDRVMSDPVLSEQLTIEPFPCTYYMGFTTTKPPMDNPLVRQALSAAVDRTSLIENVLKGGQVPAHSFAPPGMFGTQADNMEVGEWMVMEDYGEQVAQAQAWMEEAGYPNGAGLELTIMHNTSEAHAQIAQALQSMWTEAFPEASFTIENQEWGVYLETLDPGSPVEGKPHIFRMGWCADYPDENNWVNDVFNSQSGNNYALYNNPEFDSIVQEAAVEQDPAVREELYEQAETLLIETDAAIAPIYYYTTVRLQQPWMTNIVTAQAGGDPWYLWTIDWEAKREALGLGE